MTVVFAMSNVMYIKCSQIFFKKLLRGKFWLEQHHFHIESWGNYSQRFYFGTTYLFIILDLWNDLFLKE